MVIQDCFTCDGRGCPACHGTGAKPPTDAELKQMASDARKILLGGKTPEELRAGFKVVPGE